MTAPTPMMGASGYSRRISGDYRICMSSLQLDGLSVLFSKDGMGHAEAAAKEFIWAFQAPDSKQCNDVITKRQLEHFAHLFFLKALHGGRVVTQGLGHEHHGGVGDHDVAVEPHGKVGMVGKIIRDIALGLLGVVLRHSALAAQAEHLIEVTFAPSIGVTAGNDDNGGLLDLCLVEAGSAQTPFLLRLADDDKAPGLHVVSAGGAQAGIQYLLQVFVRNGRSVKAGSCATLRNHLRQVFLHYVRHILPEVTGFGSLAAQCRRGADWERQRRPRVREMLRAVPGAAREGPSSHQCCGCAWPQGQRYLWLCNSQPDQAGPGSRRYAGS